MPKEPMRQLGVKVRKTDPEGVVTEWVDMPGQQSLGKRTKPATAPETAKSKPKPTKMQKSLGY